MGVHGTSRFSRLDELLDELDARPGFLLGQVPVTAEEALKLLFTAPLVYSWLACKAAFNALAGRQMTVSAKGVVHAAFFMPPGTGKTTSIVFPKLLSDFSSTFVFDPKGEAFNATHAERARMGHQIVCLDPFGVVGGKDAFNPMDLIDPKSPYALDNCDALAEALVVKTGEEKEPHWHTAAQQFISVLMALIKHDLACGQNLQEVAGILTDREELAKALIALRRSHTHMLPQRGGAIGHYEGKELASVLTTTMQQLNFLLSPLIERNTSRSTFDLRDITKRKMTVYGVLPPEYLTSHSRLLRLWVTSLLRVIAAGGLTDRPVNIIVDEAGALGRLDPLLSAIEQLRGYGARFTLIYQSLSQLKRNFGEDGAQGLLAATSLLGFAGVNDLETAKYVSDRLGFETVAVATQSGGNSGGSNYDPMGHDTTSRGWNDGTSVTTTKREVLQPAEVAALPRDVMICFRPGRNPMWVNLVPYFSPKFQLPEVTNVLRKSVAIALVSFALGAAVVKPKPPPPPLTPAYQDPFAAYRIPTTNELIERNRIQGQQALERAKKAGLKNPWEK